VHAGDLFVVHLETKLVWNSNLNMGFKTGKEIQSIIEIKKGDKRNLERLLKKTMVVPSP
jgi:hypothetical protein